MKIKNLLFILTTVFTVSTITTKAQTQEEIERLLNGGSTKTEEVEKEAKVKKEKTEKEAKEPKVKAEKEVKASKEAVEKEVKAKTEKVKEEKEPKVKAEKEVKATEVKAKEPKTKEQPQAFKSTSSVKEDKPVRTSSSSTFDKPLRTWSVGLFGGLANPVTDIRYKNWFGTLDPVNENQWNAGIRVRKMFDGAFGLQWDASYTVLQGAFDQNVEFDDDRQYLEAAGLTEGVYFRNNVVSSSLNVYWNISNTIFNSNRYTKAKLKGRNIKDRRFSFYMYSGLGGTWFDPHVMMLDDKRPIDLANVNIVNQNIDKTIFEMKIPIGFGAKFKLGKSTDLGFEYVLNYVFTDKLDGFVYNHPERVKNDLYTNLNVTLDFKIGTKNKDKEHIEWVNPVQDLYEEVAKIDGIEKKVKKLTRDSDDDGVSDWFDKDNETEEGVVVDGSGVAIDSDGDGIPDRADLEPFSDKGSKVDEFGVAIDTDGDGVPDHLDLEPDSKKGSFVNFQGVAIEGKVKNAMSRGVSFPSVFFDTDQATIKREYEDELFMIAKDIIRMEDVKFLLSGHCDERGSDEYNNELGLRRAEAVKKYLVENYNIDASRIETVSKGKSELDSPRFNINRRVDVMFIEK